MATESRQSEYLPGEDTTSAKTILVVDDDAFMRRVFRGSLEGFGYRIVEATCGEEALASFAAEPPDLVILDLVMPGMDGFDTCAALRGLQEGKYTPVLAVTGLQDTASIHRAFEAGATDFISKPFKNELLGYRVRFLLRAGQAFEELTRSEANLQLLRAGVEALPIGITISNPQGHIIYTNPAEAAMHGYEVDELLNRETRVFAPQHLHRTWLLDRFEKSGVWRRESVNQRKSGEEFPVQLSSVAVRNAQGEFLGITTACEEITERKRSEARIRQLAYFDTLTRLPNRTLFLDRLQKTLAQADRAGDTVALLFLDLDNFKDINDTQGHDFGDRLLQEVARQLSGCLRAADTLARIGGDEFVVMLHCAEGKETASATAARILETFRQPFDIEGRKTYAGISIGIALYPEDAADVEGLLRSADTAMYQAKSQGRQNFQFFSAHMNQEIVEKVAVESALRRALEQQEFKLVFQPQWDIREGSYCGVEVLLRWHHPDMGEVSPTRFIPLAESSGQISALGEWALRSTCSQVSRWRRAGINVRRVAVNVSGHQLREPEFPALVAGLLKEADLDPAMLELEFTESVLMEHSGKTLEVLQKLQQMGVQFSLDDFGTGYSSLSYLKHFPVDRIKIDRSFVAGIEYDPGDAAIVEAVIALAHSLNIKVLAEGVETRAQLEFLEKHGCSEAQGFLFGAPMDAGELVRRVSFANRTPAGSSSGSILLPGSQSQPSVSANEKPKWLKTTH